MKYVMPATISSPVKVIVVIVLLLVALHPVTRSIHIVKYHMVTEFHVASMPKAITMPSSTLPCLFPGDMLPVPKIKMNTIKRQRRTRAVS